METNTPAREGAGKPQKSTASVAAAMVKFLVFVAIRIDAPSRSKAKIPLASRMEGSALHSLQI
jgi:hypothetical protein